MSQLINEICERHQVLRCLECRELQDLKEENDELGKLVRENHDELEKAVDLLQRVVKEGVGMFDTARPISSRLIQEIGRFLVQTQEVK